MAKQRAQQQAFEGMPIGGMRFKLASATDLLASEEYTIGQLVKGYFKGTVVGVQFEDKSGVLVRRHVVDVDEGSLES